VAPGGLTSKNGQGHMRVRVSGVPYSRRCLSVCVRLCVCQCASVWVSVSVATKVAAYARSINVIFGACVELSPAPHLSASRHEPSPTSGHLEP